jgi:N-acetylglucosaminyldiphosphoundecaprenol N-acetyl-beta-D-mannosaminyltransferase
LWWQEHSLEWLYRLLKEPKRMWRRYLVGNALFLWNVVKLKVKS